jgi:arabinogalactan endo-1,4-beta-galactosidase
MNRTIARIAATAAACAGLALGGCSKSSHSPSHPDYGVTVNAIPGLPGDFIKGADVSMLAQLEASGARFYDESGAERDALRILKGHGVNWVRLRVWNHPVIAHDFDTDGMTVHAGEAAGGINDAARDALLARRAKDLGMKVLLDFHFSDWWADPGKQWIPQAWEELDAAAMGTALHDYTAEVLATMAAAGATPDMVQLGNETNDGFLWPVGRVSVNGYAAFAALLSQAASAVRAADPGIAIAIHLANGGDNELYRSMFTHLVAEGVDFDVIGLSYYPYWHGPMEDLRANLEDVSSYFNKPVAVLETAYAWTLDDADGERNGFGAQQEALGGYKATVQGQATFLRDLMAVVAAVPDRRGLGVFYWEPDWIAVEGAGWYTHGGDGWDNQTLFDHDGKALASMNVFRAVSDEGRPWVEPTIAAIPVQELQAQLGAPAALPGSVTALYSDDSLRLRYVIWDEVDPALWNTAGTFDVAGTVPGSPLPAALHVTVMPNLVQNPGFEDDLAGWTVTDPSGATNVQASAADAHAGEKSFHWWAADPFTFSVAQEVTGLEAGRTYSLSVYVSGLAGSELTAWATCDGVTSTAPVTNTGWGGGGNWNRYTLTGLSGDGGACTVGVGADAAGGDWGNLDDVQLVEEP